MGLASWLSKKFGKAANDYRDTQQLYLIGCEVLGPPQNPRSPLERATRVKAGQQEILRRKAAEDADKARRSRQVHEGIGTVGEVAMGITAMTGLVSNPVQPPSLEQLDDSRQSQLQRHRDTISEASNKRPPRSRQQ